VVTNFHAAEQFRKLRSQIIKINSGHSIKTILVTSALQGEGKSFVAKNLAMGIAQDLNLYAMLVDCDLRNPTLAREFGVGNRKGIADYLTGGEDIASYILKTEARKLSFLPGGSMPQNPAELIGSNKMGQLIAELKSRYNDRYIILDSTPILATAEPDILTRWVDGIILVIRAGMTPRDTVEQAIDSIEREKILGVVLNDLEFKSSGLFAHYFGSKSYYYGYGYGKEKRRERESFKILRH
jgi:exopolysaccharide/PEP-CTERM locus tyrosine autokinase